MTYLAPTQVSGLMAFSYYLCGNYEVFHQAVIFNINQPMPAGFHYTFLSHMEILKITLKGKMTEMDGMMEK